MTRIAYGILAALVAFGVAQSDALAKSVGSGTLTFTMNVPEVTNAKVDPFRDKCLQYDDTKNECTNIQLGGKITSGIVDLGKVLPVMFDVKDPLDPTGPSVRIPGASGTEYYARLLVSVTTNTGRQFEIKWIGSGDYPETVPTDRLLDKPVKNSFVVTGVNQVDTGITDKLPNETDAAYRARRFKTLSAVGARLGGVGGTGRAYFDESTSLITGTKGAVYQLTVGVAPDPDLAVRRTGPLTPLLKATNRIQASGRVEVVF
jgi:hypothetical protein